MGDKWWHELSTMDPHDYLELGERDKEEILLNAVEKIYNIHKWLTVGEL